MKLWSIPQKLAKPPPRFKDGNWPVVYCFRCGCTAYELVREGGRQDLIKVNDTKQVYFVMKDEENPTNDGSRMRIPLCGTCQTEMEESE